MRARLLEAGTLALLVEPGAPRAGDPTDAAADAAALAAVAERLRAVPGVVEVVPGAETLLVRVAAGPVPRAAVRAALEGAPAGTARARTAPAGTTRAGTTADLARAPRTVVVPVRYDGEDLAEVARILGTEPAEVVRRHTAATHRVAFTGFAPGFAYLAGARGLEVPRRATPRTRIPAGAVGLAGPYSGVYPRASPGGWQLVGTTDVPMWDLERDPPALLLPGDEVRFVDAATLPDPAGRSAADLARDAWSGVPREATVRPWRRAGSSGLELVASTAPAAVEDLGRPGLAHLGVTASGALDPPALRAANRAVGNGPSFACLELTGSATLRAVGRSTVAVAGAVTRAAVVLEEGDEITLDAPAHGQHSYVAVRGGIDVPQVLGSASTDLLSGLGPAPVRPGEIVPVRDVPDDVLGPLRRGAPPRGPRDGPHGPGAGPEDPDVVVVDVVLGPRDDWFDDESLARLLAQEWTVTPRLDRVGARLEGPHALVRREERAAAELPSEGVALGALQVPPDGQPVLLLADHPVTGGYPVVAVVAAADVPRAAQVPPGGRLRFRRVEQPSA
ncbi:urea amidolyase family protein [Cellulomonas sp. PhB143]|uniref:5-oxoprolinase subunit B/C family protein n=1 Tax=Cellulomonas sp. PhB143 TaxID=2485186 RepID=UPI000F474A7E|nr:urea amidolyase family protein [Cellulomonas sp. PhB143]ROS78830.1 KipI family sensor histidine kinase inhibitor [Cellulomonas sp. PhB143]